MRRNRRRKDRDVAALRRVQPIGNLVDQQHVADLQRRNHRNRRNKKRSQDERDEEERGKAGDQQRIEILANRCDGRRRPVSGERFGGQGEPDDGEGAEET
jgi:hypothetical protein